MLKLSAVSQLHAAPAWDDAGAHGSTAVHACARLNTAGGVTFSLTDPSSPDISVIGAPPWALIF